jgi:hypothetical protein
MGTPEAVVASDDRMALEVATAPPAAPTMSSESTNDRKRKLTEDPPAAVVNSDDQDQKESNKTRKVGTNDVTSNATSPETNSAVTTERASTTNAAVASTVEEESMQSIGVLVRDLLLFDNAKVNVALKALYRNLRTDKQKCENIVKVGGCLALIQLVKNCLEKVIEKNPACDQVTELNELAGLTTLKWTITVIYSLAHMHDVSKEGFIVVGGVETVVEVTKMFPKCEDIQKSACAALGNLTYICNIGRKRAVEAGGIEVLLAAVNNHLGSASVCGNACCALANIVTGFNENIERLITQGGTAAVDKVSNKWPDNDKVQTRVQRLNQILHSQSFGRSGSESSKVATEVPAVSSQSRDDGNRKPMGTPEAVVDSDDRMSSEFSAAIPKVPTTSSQPTCRSDLAHNPTETPEAVAGTDYIKSSEAATASKKIPTMPSQRTAISSQPGDDHKRNAVDNSVAVITSDVQSHRERKPRRVRTGLSSSSVASPQTNEPVATEGASTAHITAASITQHDESASDTEPPEEPIQSIWMLIRDLNHSDTAKVDAALEALRVDLVKDSTIWDHFVAVGSCFATVQLAKLVVKETMRWISEE